MEDNHSGREMKSKPKRGTDKTLHRRFSAGGFSKEINELLGDLTVWRVWGDFRSRGGSQEQGLEVSQKP